MHRGHLLVGTGIVLVVTGVFMVPELEISQPEYGFSAYEVNEAEIEERNWEVVAFENLSEPDQERFKTMLEGGDYYTYDGDDIFDFDVVRYEDELYRIEISDNIDPAPFPFVLTAPLVLFGGLSLCYGSYRLYRGGG